MGTNNGLTVRDAVDEFITLKQATLAPATASDYSYQLRALTRQYGEMGLGEITESHLTKLLIQERNRQSYKGTKLTPASIADLVKRWRIFFNWACEGGLIAKNPSAKIKAPKPPQRIKSLTWEQVEAIRAVFEAELYCVPPTPAPNQHAWGDVLRTRALFDFLMDAPRSYAAANLRVEDLFFDQGHVIVTLPKGEKAQVKVSPSAVVSITEYLNGRASGPVFLRDSGEVMTAHDVRNTLRWLRGRLGITSDPKFWNQTQAAIARTQFDRVIHSRRLDLPARPQGKHRMPWKGVRRDNVIFLLMLESALRRQEIVNLNLEDVHLDQGYLVVQHGKGDKRRAVGLGTDTVNLLREYIGDRRGGPLFLTETVQRLQAQGLRGVYRRISARVGFDVFPHMMRHTSASARLLDGMPPEQVQSHLGHANFEITRGYVKAVMEQATIAAGQKYSPVSKLLHGNADAIQQAG